MERRQVAQALHVGLGGAQLVPGEVRLDRGEAELGRALGQHRVQRDQPRVQRAQLDRGQADLAQAAQLQVKRVVVAVDDHLRVAGQVGQPGEQLEVVLAERGQLLLEVGRGRLVIARLGHRAEPEHGRPVQVVRAHADDHRLGLGGLLRGVDLRRDQLPAAAFRAEQALADRGAVAGQVHHRPAVGPGQVLGVGIRAPAAHLVGVRGVAHPGQPGAGRGGVTHHHHPHPGQRGRRPLAARVLRLAAHQLA